MAARWSPRSDSGWSARALDPRWRRRGGAPPLPRHRRRRWRPRSGAPPRWRNGRGSSTPRSPAALGHGTAPDRPARRGRRRTRPALRGRRGALVRGRPAARRRTSATVSARSASRRPPRPTSASTCLHDDRRRGARGRPGTTPARRRLFVAEDVVRHPDAGGHGGDLRRAGGRGRQPAACWSPPSRWRPREARRSRRSAPPPACSGRSPTSLGAATCAPATPRS